MTNTNVMPEDRFWALIDKTLDQKDDPGAQLDALTEELGALSASDIESFERAFQQAQRKSYKWDLWAAAFILNGGASDDGFEYFQRWLISRGRKVFDAANNNADSLAAFLSPSSGDIYEFEEFAHAASTAWQQKTGINPWKDPQGRFPHTGGSPAGEPAGTPFEEDEDYLSEKFPKLWAFANGAED